MRRLIELPLVLTPMLEFLARGGIGRELHLGGLSAPTMSGVGRVWVNGNCRASQQTGDGGGQKHLLPHEHFPFLGNSAEARSLNGSLDLRNRAVGERDLPFEEPVALPGLLWLNWG